MLSRTDPSAEPVREIGGYRVVRTLSTSPHAVRLLVHDDTQAWVARVFSHDCPDDVIDREVAVSDLVSSASGPLRQHVSVVRDLCTTPDGRVGFIEEHLAGPRLDTALDVRHGRWSLGEAVTVLAPLVNAIDEGHGLGLTGLLLNPADVRLRDSGAPVLTRRSNASMGPALPDRFRHREPRYAADRDALERVGASVAAAIGGEEAAALVAVLRRRGPALDHALFDLAPPMPVRWDPEPEASDLAPAPVWAPAAAATSPTFDDPLDSADRSLPLSELRASVTAALSALGLPATIVSVVHKAAESLAQNASRVATMMPLASRVSGRAVRPRFVVAAAGGALALVMAIVISVQAGATHPGSAAEGGPVNDGGTAGPLPAPGVTEGRAGAVGLAETEVHPAPESWPDLIDELVVRWIACVSGGGAPTMTAEGADDRPRGVLRESCVESVAHEGSAAAALVTADDPRHDLLRNWLLRRGEVVVVERMGAAVLLDLVADNVTTASLLVVRSEAGWRIRDVIG